VIVFSMRIVAPDERRSALLRTLGSLLRPTRVLPGCKDACLYADLDRRNVVVLVEEWETREQFEQQLDAEKLRTLVAALELSSEAPMVRIDTVSREEGVDTLALHQSLADHVDG
jgi:quinol monooxygenase YgiN